MAKAIKITPFEQAKTDLYAGKISAPSVSVGTDKGIINVPYFRYQLAVHKMELSLMSKGMKLNRHSKLKPLKDYYGLKGKTAADCLSQFIELVDKYEAELVASN